MKTPVWTWLPGSPDPVLAAHIDVDAGQGKFWYQPAYMDAPLARALDPLHLRFSRKGTGIPMLKDGGLPGVVADAMPAGYGADRLHALHGRTLTALELLALGPPDGAGAIEVCHDIERKLAWQPHTLAELRTHIQQLDHSAPASRAIRPAPVANAPNSRCNTKANCGWPSCKTGAMPRTCPRANLW